MRCSTLRGTFCWLITLATPRQDRTVLTRAGGRVEVVASLSQGRTAAAQCGLFTHKSVPVIFEPPCTLLVLFSGVNNDGITVEVPAATRANVQTTCPLDRRAAPDVVQKSQRYVKTRNSIALFTRAHSLSQSCQINPFHSVSSCLIAI